MYVIGLTGSIGMGKSTALKIIKKMKIPVFCADESAHLILEKKDTQRQLQKLFPDCKKLTRKKIGDLVFSDQEKLRKLNKIIHPLVMTEAKKFIDKNKKAKRAVLDVPLLFESGMDKICDVVLCVTASEKKQKKRVMTRAGMTEEKFEAIKKGQMSEKEKTGRADILLDNGKDLAHLEQQIRAFFIKLEFGYFGRKKSMRQKKSLERPLKSLGK